MLMRMVLDDSGYQVEEASTGEAALRACTARMSDFIFLDAVLPDADGFELCRHMRDLPGGRAIPIMMVTGLEPVQAQRLAKQVDASACIAKPIYVPSL